MNKKKITIDRLQNLAIVLLSLLSLIHISEPTRR